MKKTTLIWLAVLAGLVLAPAAAFANLSAVGPVVPYVAGPPGTTGTGNGFPHFYTDANGVSVTTAIPAFGDGLGLKPPTQIFAPVLTAPIGYTQAMIDFSKTIGFDVECFYYYLQPDRVTFDQVIDPAGKGGAVNCILGLEMGFATPNPVGAPQNGQQGTFQRIRFNWFSAPIGVYKFTHPYGVETMTATGGARSLLYTLDTPLISPGNFTTALTGKIGPFLRQTAPPLISIGTPPPYNNPALWLGDGFTTSTFTGAVPPNLNQFKLEAFLLDGVTPNNIFFVPGTTTPTNTVTTNKAVISGIILPKKGKIGGMIDLLLLD